MDRCRCKDYAAAVKKLRIYTVGNFPPDIIDNYDRSQYVITWVKHGVDYEDLKFSKPRAIINPTADNMQKNQLKPEQRKIEQMWCRYMTPITK